MELKPLQVQDMKYGKQPTQLESVPMENLDQDIEEDNAAKSNELTSDK